LESALKLAIDFAGLEHILAGSDYPHQIGSIPEMLKSLRSLPIPAGTKRKSSAETRQSCYTCEVC